MMNLWLYFLIAFALGFIVVWFSLPDEVDSSFIVFESEEELQQVCWEGLRKGVK